VNLFTTCTHHSKLHVITALSLISTLYKSLHAKSFPACCVSNIRSLATVSNSGDSAASRAHVVIGEYPATELTQSACGPRYIASGWPQQYLYVVVGGCLAIVRLSFPRERVYRAVAQKRTFVYSPIA
jgi:hypothetical protein